MREEKGAIGPGWKGKQAPHSRMAPGFVWANDKTGRLPQSPLTHPSAVGAPGGQADADNRSRSWNLVTQYFGIIIILKSCQSSRCQEGLQNYGLILSGKISRNEFNFLSVGRKGTLKLEIKLNYRK